MQSKIKKVRDALLTTTINIGHYEYLGHADQYVVWSEDGESTSTYHDNGKYIQVITGTIDLFTKTEFDTLVDQIQNSLSDAGISYALESVQYEDETQYIHYEWRFEVA